MNTEPALIDAFRAIETKHSGVPGGDGANEDQARASICSRLEQSALAPDVQEFQCGIKQDWERFVFHALAKRYGIKPYRYRKQRQTTILVRLSKQFMNETLWPIFTEVSQKLQARFCEVTTALLPAIAPGPFNMAVLNHDHSAGQLCEDCRQRVLQEGV